MSLYGKTIVLGAGGSIAAYKMPLLVSLLVKQGMTVHPVITRGAEHFVAREALATMSKQTVWSGSFDAGPPGFMPHIDLGKAADMILIAPASANLIARLAHGMADDMLTDIVLAATCPKYIVPAMNTNMFENEATQANLNILASRGWIIMETGEGLLACGDVGRGKMPELDEIMDWLKAQWSADARQDLAGQRIVITAGPTQEKIDPVRYITNHSTGKMGYSLAEAAVTRGAEVTLISGPVQLKKLAGVDLVPVVSAADMSAAVQDAMKDADALIMAAAVADFTPAEPQNQKIKKQGTDSESHIKLKRTEDILATLGKQRQPGQVLCGFAMETENLIDNAKRKLDEKNLDLICANSLNEEGAGFAVDTNVLTLISRTGEEQLPRMSKRDVADKILDRILQLKADV